ncbi:hypothetical protein AGMMS49992_01230 [Clostridia bacterium]|nr:hypothetical protein AGMMS49992_01230 [Clostridia bacterium]
MKMLAIFKKLKKFKLCPLFSITMVALCALLILAALLPKRSASLLENRQLTRYTVPEAHSLWNGLWERRFEDALGDQFPIRDAWASLQSVWDTALGHAERNGVLFGEHGWMFEPSAGINLGIALANADALNELARALPVPVTVMFVPLSSAVYPEELPRFYQADNAAGMFAGLDGVMPDVRTIDTLTALLDAKSVEPLYFRTDHHWTDVGAAAALSELLDAWDIPADGLPNLLERENFGSTFGSYYAQSPSPFVEPDEFWLTSTSDARLTVNDMALDGLFDAEAMASSRDKYACLLYGNNGHAVLEGGGSTNIVMIHDSYANMLAPQMAGLFGRIEMFDPRYFAGELYSAVGVTQAAQHKNFKLNGESVRLVDLLKWRKPNVVYLWLGVNGIDTMRPESVVDMYRKLLDQLITALPNTLFFICEVTPVTSNVLKAYPSLTNDRVRAFNEMLYHLAEEYNVYVLYTNWLFDDGSGTLAKAFAEPDGYHMRNVAYPILANYIYTHTIPLTKETN